MRRIIPIMCTIIMVIIAMVTYVEDTNIPTPEPTVTITVEPTPEPVPIPTIIPEPTPIPTIIPEPTPIPIVIPEPVWYTEYDLDLLAAVIFYEAGSDCCTDEHQRLVGQVVINRMNDPRFPSTIYNVITDTKYGVQYSTANNVVTNAGNRDIIPQRCYDNALAVLNGEIECPEDVIFQANFKQGTGVYKIMKTPYSTTYFCHG